MTSALADMVLVADLELIVAVCQGSSHRVQRLSEVLRDDLAGNSSRQPEDDWVASSRNLEALHIQEVRCYKATGQDNSAPSAVL